MLLTVHAESGGHCSIRSFCRVVASCIMDVMPSTIRGGSISWESCSQHCPTHRYEQYWTGLSSHGMLIVCDRFTSDVSHNHVWIPLHGYKFALHHLKYENGMVSDCTFTSCLEDTCHFSPLPHCSVTVNVYVQCLKGETAYMCICGLAMLHAVSGWGLLTSTHAVLCRT